MNGKNTLHVGYILRDMVMEGEGTSAKELAKNTGIHPTHLRALLDGRTGMTAEDAVRLELYYGERGISAEDWLRLQAEWELEFLKSLGQYRRIHEFFGIHLPEPKAEKPKKGKKSKKA